MSQKLPSGFRSVRDILMFLIGASGVAYEALVMKTERPTLLLLYGALMGLPYIMNRDEKNSDGGGKK